MNYTRNPDGTYTAWKYMKFDGSLLECTAQDLDRAKEMLKQEIAAWRVYGLTEVRAFNSPGMPNGKGHVFARDDLAELIKKEEELEKNENS